MDILNRPKFIDISELKKFSHWHAEPKIDGQRCTMSNIDGTLKLVREGGTVKNEQYPEILSNCLPPNTILDGELAVLDNQFRGNFVNMLQRETTNTMKIKLLSRRMRATFVAFDVIMWNGNDTRDLPLFERKGLLNKIIETDSLKVIQTNTPDFYIERFDVYNMEGLVLKEPNTDYYSTWFKIKNYAESDFIVKGYTSESRLISALELVDSDGNYVGKVNYTGIQSSEIAKTLAGKTAVVRYMKSDKYLRFPVLKELR